MITRKANWKRRIGLFLAIIMLFEGSGLQSVVALAAETFSQKTEQAVEVTQSVQIETTEPEEAAENLTISANYSLQEDKVVQNLIIKGGALQLNGHQLKVLGNITQSGGTVALKGGMLYCKGDYIFTGYSRLIMDEQNDYLRVEGDFLCQSQYEMTAVTAGILEFNGDFTQENGSGGNGKKNFVTSGTSEVIFNGKAKQNINFAGSASYFSRVTIKNSSEEGIVSDGLINSLEMNRNGVMLTTGREGKYGWQLTEDETFEGDLILIGDTLDLNGHTLTVTGNLIQENGTVKLNGGTLEVTKDYRLQRCDSQSGKNVYSASPAKLHSTKDNGVLSVKGDFITESEISHKEFFTRGEICVSGNVSQLQTSVQDNFVMSGESRIIFNGTEKQSLSLASRGSSSSRLQNFEVTNEKGLELATDIYVTGEVCDHKNPVTGKSVVPSSSATFADKYFSGNIIWNEWVDISSLNEIGGDFVCRGGSSLKNNLTVQGNVTVEENLKLNGKELKVGKDVVLKNCVHIEEGKFVCRGDMELSESGRLNMTKSADRVLVYGDFYAKSLYTMNSAYLSAGTLELKGDFIQKNVSQKGNFCASGTHRTIFSGDKKQTITFSDNYSYFNVVDIQNASEAGVYAPQGIFCNTLVKNGNKVTTDVVGTEGWQLTGDEVIEGDLELVSGELNLNGHTLTVKGNLIQSKGNVNINGGTLVVEGDYRIQGSSEENGEIIYKESSGNLLMTDKNSHLIVKGSFVMGSMYSHKDKLTAGMIEVAGDVRAVGYYQLDNFALTGDIVLILNGTAKQTVNLSNTNFSTMRVANLEIRNESEAGVVFETELPVTTSVKDYGNHTEGTLLIKPEVSFTDGSYQGNIRVADTGRLSGLKEIGGNLTVEAYPLSLTGNLKVKGGLSILNGRYLDLNGKECQVGGNVIIKGGYIKLNKGRLVCDGDLDLAYYDGTNSYLAMAYEEDYVLVKGNVRVSSRAMAKTVMEKGTFEFQGNFTQTVTENTANFIVGNGCKVVLSGNGLQTVSFASKESYFTYVDLQNKSEEGVYSEQGIHCKHIELNGNRYRTGKSGNEGFILTEDTEWNGDFLLASGTLDLNGDFLLASGTLDLNGKKLTVHGNLLQTGGTVKVNDGELRVEGNYEIKGENDEGCFASLFMTKEADRVYVTGNFVMASYADHSDCLAAGSLSVEGDFIQKTTLLATNFATQDKFELIMCGKQKQSILMESASLKNSGIANLTIDNTSEEGVSLNEVLVTNAVKVKTGKTSGYLTLASTTRFEDNTFDGDIIVKETITYPSDLHIKGNMKNSGYLRFQGNLTVDGEFSMNNFLYLEGHTLEIGGKTNIKGCDIKLNKGSVICHGDVTLGYDTSRASGFYMVNEAEYVLIEGNLYVDTGKPVTLTKGTLELQGDFIQNRYYDKNTFSQNIDCKTILSGREKQTVHFSESGSRLGTVEIKNESAEGVYFQNDSIRVLKLIRNGCRVTCDGTGTYGWTLEEDTVLEGDLNIAADVLDLNGHQLTINGNLYIGSGEVYLNGGKLDVKESLRLQNVDKNGVHTASTGILRMNDKEDKVSVGKDFIIQTVQNGKDCLTAGTLEIAGDFRQLLSDGKGADSYQPSGTHTTVFCGTKEQNISFANKNISWFQNLSVKNTKANVKLLSFMTCKGEAEDKEKKVECQNSYHMYINSLAQLKEGTFGGNVYVSNSDTLTQNITIRGCLSTNSTLDLDGHEMTVGSLKKSAGRLVLNKGKLYVLSDLIIEGYSCLTMTNEKDFIRVNGNMELITNNGVDNTLTAGTLELCGDLKVSNTLTATGTHKTILSGKKNSQGRDYIQTIKFISGGKFNELVLKKNRESCYLFSDDVENLCNHLKIEKSDEEPPLKVKGVQATKVTASSVNLSWKASTDNEEVVGYRVYRNSKLIGITTATAYNDTGLRPETSYNYTICAYDKAENVSENSDIVGIVTESDETAPSTPESMRLVTRTGSSVTVAWNRSKDNVEVAGYRIYRNDELVATVTSGETLYKDMACEDDVTYSYIVEAYDAAGNVSGQSKEVISKVRKPELKKIEPGDGAFLGGDQICLRAYYTDSGNSTGNKVRFQYCEREEDEWKDINVSYVGQQTHNETTLFSTYTWDISRLNSGEYKVRIILYDGDENMTTREVRYTIDKDGPKTPDYIEAISDNGTVDIVWSESASAKCKEYEIYRLEAGDTYKKIAVAAGRGTTTYRDRNVKEGDTYSYYIIPVDSFGQKGKATGLAKVTATADKENPVVESMTINKKRINKGTRIAVKASDNIRVASISVQYLLDKEWVEVGNIQEGEGGDNRYRQSAKGRRLYFPGDCKG